MAIVAVVGVVSLASVGAAASLGHKTSGPRIAVTPTTTRTSAWCVSTSRATAIADVVRITSMVAKGDTEHAKLMTWQELRANESASTRVLGEPSVTDQSQVWVVEVLGTVTELFGSGPTKYSWGLFEIDANGHGVLRISAGPGTTPSYWDALPDHSIDCPSDNTRPAQPFKPPAPAHDERVVVGDRHDLAEQAHVPVPAVLSAAEDGERGPRIPAHVAQAEAAVLHVQQHAAVLPVVPGRRGVRRAVGAHGCYDGRIRTRQKCVHLRRNGNTRHHAGTSEAGGTRAGTLASRKGPQATGPQKEEKNA